MDVKMVKTISSCEALLTCGAGFAMIGGLCILIAYVRQKTQIDTLKASNNKLLIENSELRKEVVRYKGEVEELGYIIDDG